MKTIAVFALLAVAAYAQIAPSVLTEPLPVSELIVLVVAQIRIVVISIIHIGS